MNGGTLMYMRELLAQCSCGGGNTRISIWAVLIPAAVVLLCGFAYDTYARRRARATRSEEPLEPQGERSRDEE